MVASLLSSRGQEKGKQLTCIDPTQIQKPGDGYGLDLATLSNYFAFSSCGSLTTHGFLLINQQQVVLQSCGSIGFRVMWGVHTRWTTMPCKQMKNEASESRYPGLSMLHLSRSSGTMSQASGIGRHRRYWHQGMAVWHCSWDHAFALAHEFEYPLAWSSHSVDLTNGWSGYL